MSRNTLTSDQVDQLVDAAAKDPCASWNVLRIGPKFNPEQQQKLVDCAAKSAIFAASVLTDVPWLTDTQKIQLKQVS